MASKYNPYQVICIGERCRSYDKCKKDCILKNGLKNHIKGCHYSNKNDCKYCSHKHKCILIKPFSEEIYNLEVKRFALEKENKKLHEYISTWDEIENDLDDYNVDSVLDVVYFERSKQQMIDRINDNNRLIKAYLKKENDLIN